MAIQQECGWLKVASESFREGPIELLMKSLAFSISDISMTFTEICIDDTMSY